ncbi:unnamed protein product, partial [Gulo gulo]
MRLWEPHRRRCRGKGWDWGGDRVSSSGPCRIQSRSWVRDRNRSAGKGRERSRSEGKGLGLGREQ